MYPPTKLPTEHLIKLAKFIEKEMHNDRYIVGSDNKWEIFKPDTNPEHFKYVWNKLTDDQQLSALQIVIDKQGLPKDYDSPEEGFVVGLIYGGGLFCNHMPEVIDAVLEVI